jgi:hypothetical protein
MKKFIIIISIFASWKTQSQNKVDVPKFGDKYSNYVSQLESGKIDIDYADFRNSF